MPRSVLFILIFYLCLVDSEAQNSRYVLKGTVTDRDSKKPIAGANIIEINSGNLNGTSSDISGRFRLFVPIGRISVKISFLGYESQIIRDILIVSGKEVEIEVVLQEKVVQTSEVIVSPDRSGARSINQMATISTNTIRTDDALRYAGGFYDPSRIVNAFAGVATANSDESNNIVIRGNSSRGLLWRVEGIEIPNPNHFSEGQGGSGGAFSSITTNVISNFDFFTGAFPAEFGNAFSGVMDLNLRKGNPDKHEFAFQTGMIGAELSAEGPFPGSDMASFLIDARYTNFRLLSDLDLIDLGETNYAPRTKDLALNINLPFKKPGNLNFFGLYGSSAIGKIATHDTTEWNTLSDQWEELEKQSSAISGLKHLYIFPGAKTYTKTVIAYTSSGHTYREGYLDSSLVSTDSYSYNYNYPSVRASLLVNHKLNPGNTFRAGFNMNFLTATMSEYQKNSSGVFDTLVRPDGKGELYQGYVQWKHRPTPSIELNTGVHFIESSLNAQLVVEPRFGLRLQVSPGTAFVAGAGLHSQQESLAVYYALIREKDGTRSALNKDLELSKAFHLVGGVETSPTDEIRLRIEVYIQSLYNIPIIDRITSQYSALNSSERLPNDVLVNKGTGLNKGIEVTLEKSFTRNYYFLVTGSLFNSWYKAGDMKQHNTYYNTRYVSNLLAGKDFYTGKDKRNSIGFNLKSVMRGGYRYTPVNIPGSLKAKRIITDSNRTYESQLPGFFRLDAGINFRSNHPRYSWIIMLDIQNATNRHNVFRRRFDYKNGAILTTDVHSLGAVPVFNFRVEF